MTDAASYVTLMPEVARHFWGNPNKGLSSKDDWRWGKHGSKSVKLSAGTWYDNEEKVGGGLLKLVEKQTGNKGEDALRWLIDNGFEVEGFDEERKRPTEGERERPVAEPKKAAPAPAKSPPLEKKPELSLDQMKVAKTWDYVDEDGAFLFQVVRLEGEDADGPVKTYRQRTKDDDGKWTWKVKGLRQVPYRLPELIEAVAAGKTIYVVEGEKCADKCFDYGFVATCNAGGAGKFPDPLVPFFAGADVVILPDDDPQSVNKETGALLFHPDGRPKFTGKDHARLVARQLHGTANSIKVLPLYDTHKKQDVFDWFLEGHTDGELTELVAKAPLWTPDDDFITKFHALPWSHLDDKGPEHEWLVKNLLTRGERSLLAGASQSGKSFFALDLALSIARGIPFFGMKTMHGGVIYQAGEGGRGIKKRLRAYRQFNGLGLDKEIPFVLLPAAIDLHGDDKDTDMIIDEMLHWARTFPVKHELTVIDTLSAATPGANENASDDMSKILARCTKIAEATKSHVMLVHHMNADGGKPRGHTSIFANLENVITLVKLEGISDVDKRAVREAVVTKQKDGEDGARIRFVLAKEVIGQDKDGDEVSSCVVLEPNEGAMAGIEFAADPTLRLPAQAQAFLRSIHMAIEEHGEPAPPSLRLPQDVRVVRGDKVREVFERMTFEADGEVDPRKRDNAIRKAIQRHGTLLVGKQILGRNSPYIWLTGKAVAGFRRPPKVKPIADPELPLDRPEDGRDFDDDLPS